MTLEQFKRSQKPQKNRSILCPYLEDILDLQKNDYTLGQICEYLMISKNIKTTKSNLSSFLHRFTSKQETVASTVEKESKDNKSDSDSDRIKKWLNR